jgi:hypothetical protein
MLDANNILNPKPFHIINTVGKNFHINSIRDVTEILGRLSTWRRVCMGEGERIEN